MDEDKVINKLLEHDAMLDRIQENMATKADLGRITQTLDEMLGILRRVDQERVFTNEVIRRMQEELKNQQEENKRQQAISARHEEQIQRIKHQLQIA